jgi:hypothetical protein
MITLKEKTIMHKKHFYNKDYLNLYYCHTGAIKVFTYKNIEFYGGGLNRDCNPLQFPLTIGLTPSIKYYYNIESSNIPVKYLPDFAKLKSFYLFIPWEDYDIPDLTLQDWKDLLTMIENLHKDYNITKVLFCCDGGHGRTGTALAIMAYLCNIEKENPIAFIRQVYCKKAIETAFQEYYVLQICNITNLI